MPGKPNAAAYRFNLSRRIQAAFEEELRFAHNERIHVGKYHAISLRILVSKDGHIGVSEPEVRRLRRQETILAELVLRTLIHVTEHPEPFQPELVQEVGSKIVFSAHVYIP
jgi:hypothetical protein